jgi:hypothetical protein
MYLKEKITSGDYVLGSVDVLMIIINGLHVINFFIFLLLVEDYIPRIIFIPIVFIVFAYFFTINLRTYLDPRFIERMNHVLNLYRHYNRNIQRDLVLVLLYIVFPILGIFVQRVFFMG